MATYWKHPGRVPFSGKTRAPAQLQIPPTRVSPLVQPARLGRGAPLWLALLLCAMYGFRAPELYPPLVIIKPTFVALVGSLTFLVVRYQQQVFVEAFRNPVFVALLLYAASALLSVPG